MVAALIILGFYGVLAIVIFTSKSDVHHPMRNYKDLSVKSIKPPPPTPINWKVK